MAKAEAIKFRVYPYYKGNTEGNDISPQEADWELDENGVPFIAGYHDVNDFIQQFEEECDINTIVLRHLKLGTLDELAAPESDSFVDVSNIPDDLNGQFAMAKKTKAIYDSLTPQQQELFTDYEDFLINFDKLFKSIEKVEEKGEKQE